MTICRRGFTLVELLVVMAITGIMIAMLLPALQSSREVGRRATCANNLRRLALANSDYQSAHEFYPAGVTDSQGPILNEAKGMHHGWIEQLLPYLDERVVQAKIDFKVSVYDPKNAAVRSLRLPELLCPSDDVVEESPHSSYAGCHNDTEAPIAADNRGVFFLNSRLRPEDITDGLAYTLFLSEKQTEGCGTDLGWMSGTRATLRNTGTELNRTGPRAYLTQQALQRQAPIAAGPSAVAPVVGPPSTIEAPERAAPPVHLQANLPARAVRPATKGPPLWLRPKYVGGFGSDHPGGIVVTAMGDGSVRFLTDCIDPSVLKLLGNRADGKIINPRDLQR